MRQVKVHQAKSDLSRLLAAVEAGEEIVIARGDTPVALLTAVARPRPQRRFGAYRGQFWVGDAFLEPLSEDELAAWEGEAP